MRVRAHRQPDQNALETSLPKSKRVASDGLQSGMVAANLSWLRALLRPGDHVGHPDDALRRNFGLITRS